MRSNFFPRRMGKEYILHALESTRDGYGARDAAKWNIAS
jgi:hypothetical protein